MKPSQSSPSDRVDPLRDPHLIVVLIGSLLTGVGLWYTLPQGFAEGIVASPLLLMNTLLLYPVVEELLFRGVIQGALLDRSSLTICHLGISRANMITSLLFVSLHLVNQSPGWALAVLVPSLALGHIRERYSSLAAPILLHIVFNATYLIAGAYT
jgi:membrane protease YdiL (CAAX protease family)